MRDYPTYRLTASEFMALPEYSGSLPTGTTKGKRWKAQYSSGRWYIGEYGGERFVSAYGDEKHSKGVGDFDPRNPKGPLINHQCRVRCVVDITWYKPIIIVTADASERQEPEPDVWTKLIAAFRLGGWTEI
jgi:hypothetical protein